MLAILAYLAAIVGSNVAFATLGVIPVGFGFMAPVAVFVVGFTFIFRDMVQETYGKKAALAVMAVGLALSLPFAPGIASASMLAFVASELVDFAAFTLLRRAGFLPALVGSNVASIIVDSLIFLSLAFGSLAFLPGQIVGKVYATIVAGAVVTIRHRTVNG